MRNDETFRVAATQLNSNNDVQANLAATVRVLRGAAHDGARLAVVPECFASLGAEDEKLAIAEDLQTPGPILSMCQSLARELEMEIVLGGFWEKGSDATRVKNACVHISSDGVVGAVYRKIHLFDVDLSDGTKLCESDTVEAGNEVVVADTCFGKLGLSVCYDLRFPELYRRLVDQGAVALTVPAAFTLHTGKDHWEPLLRARAIENQAYVIAAAQTGRHIMLDKSGTRASWGHGMIVDPWGAVIAQCREGEGWCVGTIDLAYQRSVRASLPNLRHRRPEVC